MSHIPRTAIFIQQISTQNMSQPPTQIMKPDINETKYLETIEIHQPVDTFVTIPVTDSDGTRRAIVKPQKKSKHRQTKAPPKKEPSNQAILFWIAITLLIIVVVLFAALYFAEVIKKNEASP